MEVKLSYGTSTEDITKSWSPRAKSVKQSTKYADKFGPGLLVYKYGHSQGFSELLHEHVTVTSWLDAEIINLHPSITQQPHPKGK